MRLPQRFKRLPSEEPCEGGEGISLPTYPLQLKMETRSDGKGRFSSDPVLDHANTAYNAGTYNTAPYTISHPMTLVERVEHEEKRRYGTSFFGKFYDIFVGGWRAGLLRAFLFSFLALVVNISVYAWLFRTYEASTRAGTATIYRASCNNVRGANTGIHVVLNIVSTLILGASTYAMQGMTAPTRKEVDVAHAKGKWVEIGTQSVRNLFHTRRRNTWVWMLLGATSLPFHLL
jgi:hypothetical protein